MNSIGDRLRAEREKLGVTQSLFAAMGGVTLKSQQNYELSKRIPGAEYLAAIAHVADIQYIVTGERWGDYGRKDKALCASSDMERGMLAAAMVLEVVSELPASQKDRVSSVMVKTLCAFVYEQCPTKESLRAFLHTVFLVKDGSGEA